MFYILLKKEFLELRRTSKLLIYLAVFFISGLISPVLAKYTPVLLNSIPNLPAGFAGMIPEPTVQDAISQYIKNVSQFGILLVILLTMGVLAQEKERGTAAMLLTKPVKRSAVVLSKWVVGLISVLAGLILGGLGCTIYTAVLFEILPLGQFALLNLLLLVYFSVFLSVALLASTLVRTQSMAAVGAFGGLAILLILGAIPRVSDYLPGQLLAWGTALVFKGGLTAWPALAVSIGLIILCLASACAYFEREEI
jgi:ABC-2 type transport system permease protein